MNAFEVNGVVSECPYTPDVALYYPRSPGSATHIQFGLMDVRAADSIRISYDFERDGYVIEQASRFEWPADDVECDPGWQEVAFVKAWARRPETEL